MIYKATIFTLVLVILLGSVGYFGYTAWQAHEALTKQSARVVLSDVQVAENRERLVESLTISAGVTLSDALRGFWYRYMDENGIEQLAFLNPNQLAQNELTDWHISNISEIVVNSTVLGRDYLDVVSLADLPDEYQFHNSLYRADKDSSFVSTRDELEQRVATDNFSQDDLFRLGYIYEIEGKYAERDALNKKSCELFGERCERELMIVIKGKVADIDGMPIQSADISLLSGASSGVIAHTNKDGLYYAEIPVRQMEKLRVRATKRNYSDGIANAVVLTTGKKEYVLTDIILGSPLNIVTLDNKLGTITGDSNSYNITVQGGGEFIIQTPQSKYTIPANAIVHKDGAEYQGEMEVYLYEFTRDTAPESLLAVDTMDSVLGYAGDLMKSFGMPYIQFFTPGGEELHVLKSNPMKIEYRIYHMEELYNNSDGIYKALTLENMQDLVFASLGGNYPIDREYLINNDVLQFPAFWVFDRTVGVWENVGINVVTADGLIESMFYTLNDGR